MNQGNPLGYEKISKLLKGFAIPSIVAMLVSSLYNIVDQIFIGHGVGYLGNAATNVSYPLTTICLAIALLIGVGSAARFSLHLGRKEEEEAAKIVGNGVCMTFILGILYLVIILLFLKPMLLAFGGTPDVIPYALEYTRITAFGMPLQIVTTAMSHMTRADGSPKYSMRSMIIGAIINTILDPIFIFIFKMGVAGAAIATVAGQFCSFVYALRYLKQFKSVELKKEHFRFSFRQSFTTASMGISNSMNQMTITLVQIVLNNSLTHYGALSIYGSDIPLAANGIVMKTNGILMAFLVGLVQGMQPIVGYNYGAKQYDRVRATYKLSVCTSLCMSSVAFVLFQFFPRTVLSIFGDGEALYFEFATRFMRIFLLMVMANGVQMLSANLFSAIGQPMKGLFLTLTRQVIFLIPLMLVLPRFFGIDGVLFSAPVADTLAIIVTTIFVYGELKKMKKLAN